MDAQCQQLRQEIGEKACDDELSQIGRLGLALPLRMP
jgi:hypothetical protein